MSNKLEYTLMQRDGYCRGCDKLMQRNSEKAIKTYSIRNRGQHILLCKECVKDMYNLTQEEKQNG